ncbi:MAG: universal stress protein [Candidatus Dormibacteria bacterium]
MNANKIVVGVDGSTASNAALNWAVQAAAPQGADIIAVHVLKPIGEHAPATSVSEVRLREFAYLGAHIRSRVESELFGPLTTSTVKHRMLIVEGHPASEILRVADAEDAGLIVVGNGVHSTMEDLFLGRVAHELTHRSRRPLVVIPLAAYAGHLDTMGRAQHTSNVTGQTRSHCVGEHAAKMRSTLSSVH